MTRTFTIAIFVLGLAAFAGGPSYGLFAGLAVAGFGAGALITAPSRRG